MPKEFNPPSKSKFNIIKKYVLAAINLYGVIKLDDFISIFNHYETSYSNKQEIVYTLELLSNIDEVDLSFRQNIMSNGLLYLGDNSDLKEAKELIKLQGKKPRYLPSKAEFLKYENDDYVEPMKLLLDFEKFIKDNQMVKIEEPIDIRYDVLQLHDEIVFGGSISDYMDYIFHRGYQFKDDTLMKLFMGFVIEIHNHTRMYENNGFTPIELRKLYDKDGAITQ